MDEKLFLEIKDICCLPGQHSALAKSLSPGFSHCQWLLSSLCVSVYIFCHFCSLVPGFALASRHHTPQIQPLWESHPHSLIAMSLHFLLSFSQSFFSGAFLSLSSVAPVGDHVLGGEPLRKETQACYCTVVSHCCVVTSAPFLSFWCLHLDKASLL